MPAPMSKLETAKKIVKRKLKGGKFLDSIGIAVNGSCNLKCEMCDIGQQNADANYYQTLNTDQTLSLELLERIAEENGGRASVHINATEPLLYKDIGKAISLFTSRDTHCALTTNGYLLRAKADELLQSNVHEINISIDGPRDIHDMVRGVSGTYERCIEGIKYLLEQDSDNLKVRVAIALSNLNYETLSETVKTMKNIGVHHVTVSHLNFITEDMAIKHNKKFGDVFGTVSISSISDVIDLRKVDIVKW